MKNSETFRKSLGMLIISACSYILMHFMFDLGDFPLFKGIIGPKNFLPLTMGMIWGPFGAVGMLVGSGAVGILSKADVAVVIYESIAALIMSAGGWLLWYMKGFDRCLGLIRSSQKRAKSRFQPRKSTGGLALKTARDLFRYTVISIFLSAVCGFIAYLSGFGFLTIFVSYMAWNLLMGIPVIMLMTSIFCVNVVYPSWHPVLFDIHERLPIETQSITVIGDIIDELCFDKRLDRKRGFQLQSCIEECFVLIGSEPSCQTLQLTVRINDSISMSMQYDGKPCNPLRERVYEDQIGLMLIKQRALRANHRYYGRKNHLHIVL
ncbi:MAG: hypothetical protein LBM69_08215 [Lachnospiraceae bacterium]|jgi:hypothetical protein|nr:hypothetical protein [Lachnospiraceae bacterium]